MGQLLHQKHVEGCQHCQTIGCCTTGEKLKHVPDPTSERLSDPEVEVQTITSDDVGSLEEVFPDLAAETTTNEDGGSIEVEQPEGQALKVVVNEGMRQKEDV